MKQMNKIILALAVIGLAACNNNSEQQETRKDLLPANLVNNPRSAQGMDTAAFNALPTMDFKDTMHNFGSMHEGEMSTYDFEFTNNGKQPLIISNAIGSCGCTVPSYPHEPVQPGKSSVMKVQFNSAGKMGHQEKSVTISTNSKRGTHMLYIKADVQNDDNK
jgi:hypothetical protein